MPTYRYESKNASGKVNSGVLTAATLAAASQQLRARGEYIVALAPADAGAKQGTDALEIGFAAPFVSLYLDGSRVNTYRGRTFTQATATAHATGFADLVVRTT